MKWIAVAPLVTLTFVLKADVQFDVTAEVGATQQLSAAYRLEWVPVPLYDISPDLYLAPIKSPQYRQPTSRSKVTSYP